MNLALSFRTFCSLRTTTTTRTGTKAIGSKTYTSSSFILPTQKHTSQLRLTLSTQSLHTTSIPTIRSSSWNNSHKDDTTTTTTKNLQITSFSTQAMQRPLSSLCLNPTIGQPSSIVPYITKTYINNNFFGLPLTSSSFSTLVRNDMTNSHSNSRYNNSLLNTTQPSTWIIPNNTSSINPSTIGSIRFVASTREQKPYEKKPYEKKPYEKKSYEKKTIKKMTSRKLGLNLVTLKIIEERIIKRSHYDRNILPDNITYRLKKALRIIFRYHAHGKRILFIGGSKVIGERLENWLRKTKHIFIPSSAWLSGSMTNQIENSLVKKSNKNSLKLFSKKAKKLIQLKKKKDLIVICDQELESAALLENAKMKLPVIALNSPLNPHLRLVDYDVPGHFMNQKGESLDAANIFVDLLASVFKKAKKIKKYCSWSLHKLKTTHLLKKKKKWWELKKKFSSQNANNRKNLNKQKTHGNGMSKKPHNSPVRALEQNLIEPEPSKVALPNIIKKDRDNQRYNQIQTENKKFNAQPRKAVIRSTKM